MELPYNEFVQRLAKNPNDILHTLTPMQMDMLHMAIGVAGEGGELLDAAKKYAIYNKPLDRDNVIEELGDLEFYMQGIRNILGITREEVIGGNRVKLAKRYASLSYSDAAAIERADKK